MSEQATPMSEILRNLREAAGAICLMPDYTGGLETPSDNAHARIIASINCLNYPVSYDKSLTAPLLARIKVLQDVLKDCRIYIAELSINRSPTDNIQEICRKMNEALKTPAEGDAG